MTHHSPPEHFKGKTVSEHLKDARRKGANATSEPHGVELPGHFAAASDTAKETALFFLLLWALFFALPTTPFSPIIFFISFAFGLIIWKSTRSALLGWARLERLHRLIEEERWEIQHHRQQERDELKDMYAAKGFSGKLLDEVVDVLMADDNRLLNVMLEEELGLRLEAYEHPLKQAFGAFLATLITSTLLILAYYFWPLFGLPTVAIGVILFATQRTSKFEKRDSLKAMIWNCSCAILATLCTYLLTKLLIS